MPLVGWVAQGWRLLARVNASTCTCIYMNPHAFTRIHPHPHGCNLFCNCRPY